MTVESHSPIEWGDCTRAIGGGAFVGRQRELGILTDTLEASLARQGQLALLAGEPGIGKTRTAQELALRAEMRGAQVLWGRCYEGEGAPPYWPWIQILRLYIQQLDADQLRSHMGAGAADIAEIVPLVREKLPGLEPAPALEPEQARFRLFDSIATFLKKAGEAQPLLLVLDDIHWADQPSLLLLHFLARQLDSSRLLVVGCYRDVEVSRQHPLSETLAELSRETVFQRHLLQGLSQGDTERFIEMVGGIQPSQKLVETLYARTEGNPFFMTEVIRSLRERGELAPDSTNGPQSVRIPEGVREVIGQRLNRLSEPCSQTLVTASVIGREFEFSLLSMVSNSVSEDRLLSVMDEALRAHLIEELPGRAEGFQFRHALIQETLASELSAARRVRLHARIAQALEELYGADAESHASELAYHFAQAAPVLGPEKLVKYSLLAGEQAQSTYAYEEALLYFERGLAGLDVALDTGDPAWNADAAALLFGRGRTLAALRGPESIRQAIVDITRAFEYYAAVGDIEQVTTVAQHPVHPMLGQRVGVTELVGRALELVPAESHYAGRLLAHYGMLLSQEDSDYERAEEAFAKGLEIAQRERDVALELQILARWSHVANNHLHFQESLEKCIRALEIAPSVNDLKTEGVCHNVASMVYRSLGNLPAAEFHAQAALELARRLRDSEILNRALVRNVQLSVLQGYWSAGRAFIDEGLDLWPTDSRLLGNRAILEHEVGETVDGDIYLIRLLDAMRKTRPGPSNAYAIPALVIPVIGRITQRTDHLEAADEAVRAVLAPIGSPAVSAVALRARAGAAMLAVLRGDQNAAQEHYASLISHQDSMVPLTTTAVDHLLGLLAKTVGNLDRAIQHFEDSSTFCNKAGYRPELAWTLYDQADALLERNHPKDRDHALSLLGKALGICTELSMRPLRDRVVRLQAEAQLITVPTPDYPRGLSRREVEVLRLIASGKTDREIAEELFISIKTVSYHVGNILNKTACANRTEAATFASQNGLV